MVQSLLDIITDYQKEYKFQKVNSLTLQYGKLSGINPKSIVFAFDVLSNDSVANGSKLILREIPPRIRCEKCHSECIVKNNLMKCQKCGSKDVILVGGMEELKLLEMDVD